MTNDILPSSIAWRISDLSVIDRNNVMYYMIIFTLICNLIGISILNKINQIIKIFDKKTIGFLSPNEIISSLGNK